MDTDACEVNLPRALRHISNRAHLPPYSGSRSFLREVAQFCQQMVVVCPQTMCSPDHVVDWMQHLLGLLLHPDNDVVAVASGAIEKMPDNGAMLRLISPKLRAHLVRYAVVVCFDVFV